jgi:hypothetical protein
MRAFTLVLLASTLSASPIAAEDADGFVPLFNGKDLSGWVNINCAPETFSVQEGMIHCTGAPICALRTDRMYENFVLELEWQHLKAGGNAGVFVWADALPARGQPFLRSIEVQVLDGRNTEYYTSHGDVFAIHGARLTPDRPHPKGAMRSLPSEWRANPAGQWNHYRITANDGTIKLAVNGREVSGGYDITPRKGYLALESEGSPVLFRNLRIRELPSSGPLEPDQIAQADEGFVSLYTGVDFRGWIYPEGHEGHWMAKDWIIDYDGRSEADDKHLWTEREYGDFVLMADWRWSGEPVKRMRPVILPSGETAVDADGQPEMTEVEDAGDSGIYLRGSEKAQVNIWSWPVGSGEVYGYRTDSSMPAEVRAAVTPRVNADEPIGRWNRFLITMKGDRLTVVLNGQTVIENAQLPGVSPRGRIALQHHGDPIQFANIFIRELD